MVQKLAETVDWDAMADNVTSGLNAAFQNLNWEEAGQSLNAFLGKLSGFIVDVLEDTDWEEVGRGVGNFLKQVDWGSHLWSMITAIVDAIGDLFDGLEESGTAGKIRRIYWQGVYRSENCRYHRNRDTGEKSWFLKLARS